MAFNYDAEYSKDDESDVVKLFGAIAPVWKKVAGEVSDLDVEKLHGAVKNLVEGWRTNGDFSAVDKDLQALLAMATATSWFSEEQEGKIDEWLEEVASGVEDDWMSNFPEAGIREAMGKHLKCKDITEFTIDKEAKTISVEFEGGDYGQGKFEGNLHITESELKLYDYREEGKYLSWLGDLPADAEGLGKCLKSQKWDIAWDVEEEDW